jgi:hypothetical protein
MLLISQILLNPMYEYVAVSAKIRVQRVAFRAVCDQTTDILSEAATNVPRQACNETNLMHHVSSVYSDTIRLHVSGLLVAHHQKVTMYICNRWYVLYGLVDCHLASCPPVRHHGTILLLLRRLSSNLIFVDFFESLSRKINIH